MKIKDVVVVVIGGVLGLGLVIIKWLLDVGV